MLIVTPKIDLNGERWFFPYKKPEDSERQFSAEEESLFKLRLLVASSENPQYRSRNALVRRHIDKMDAGYKVGTTDFNLASVVSTGQKTAKVTRNAAGTATITGKARTFTATSEIIVTAP